MFRYLKIAALCLFMTSPSFAAVSMGDIRTSFKDVVKKASPAVVNIYTQTVVRERVKMFNDPFFDMFFGQTGPVRQRVERSLGSGVIVTPDGHMITNLHVIQGARKVKVMFGDKRERDAEFIAGDKRTDLALLRIKGKDGERFDAVRFADSDSAEVGDVVLAIGNPYGVGQSVSMGIISALGRSGLGTAVAENFIQTDAAINPGNSGGALIDSNGELIGINTAIFSKTGGSQGIGFAIPANMADTVIQSVLSTGRVTRPWLGIGSQDLNGQLASKLGMDRVSGVLINDVFEGGPADKAGFEIGDILMKINRDDVMNKGTLEALLAGQRIGTRVNMTLFRSGRTLDVDMKLQGLPDRDPAKRITLGGSGPLSGYVVEELSPVLNNELGLPFVQKGVAVVEVPQGRGSFAMLQLKKGDVIQQVNSKSIQTIADLEDVSRRRPRAWQIVYERAGRTVRALVR
ncbi:MAG: Do family serine endopeptidase [Alphaproteobacteria bacterium]|nr:Do family serine endopeptidase [Alphaproteobacteria bacterium]